MLIKPAADGSAHIIGGAGGKLNGLKITGVKDRDAYKAEAGQRAKLAREERKRQAERDRKDGLADSKRKAEEVIRASLGDHTAQFVGAVAAALGWDTSFPEHLYANATPAARQEAERKHASDLLKRANEVAGTTRKRLLSDGEARAAAGIGEVKLTSSKPEELSVEDLDPVRTGGRGLGFASNYGRRAAEHGLTAEALAAEVADTKPEARPGAAAAAEKRKVDAAAVAAELAGLRDQSPKLDTTAEADVRQAMDILKAQKAFREAQRKAREHAAKVRASSVPVEPQAYVIEVGNRPVDQDVVKDLEADLKTIRGRAFLDEVGRIAGTSESLGRHVGVGAYNSLNAVSLAAGGSALLDRSVVDVLGPAGAADVLARRLARDLTPEELGHVQEAVDRFHDAAWTKITGDQLQEARRFHELAHDIEIGEARTGAELAQAQELNAKRREYVGSAQRILGQSLGEMEANAALVAALQRPKKSLDVSLGKLAVEEAIKRVRALGLQRGEYTIERVGASTMLTVHEAGMDRLAAPVSREDLERTRAALDIIEGRQDEEDWLPQGVARRPDLGLKAQPGVAPRLATAFPNRPADVRQAVRSYVGARAADGDAPGEIVRDLFSEDLISRAGDRAAFMAAAEEVAPIRGPDGEMIRAETHQEAFEALADAFVRDHGGERAPLHRQDFEPDATAAEALHRALAETPEGVAAFKPIGELTPQDQAALRDAWAREYAKGDPEAEAKRKRLEELAAAEPERETDGLFGRETNPAWADWQAERNGLAEELNASTMTWGKYLAVMGRPADAYAAVQDIVRGRVLRTFADTLNTLKPGAPLKVGRTVIRNDLNHLSATDAEAAERHLAERRQLIDSLRDRVAGRYAAGAVSDKIEAAREAEAALEQSQMGLFGMAPEPPPAAKGEPIPEPGLTKGQRFTLGHRAEQRIAAMVPVVGANFRPGDRVTLWKPTMSGEFVGRQRAVKLIKQNRKTALGLGVGSGKTSISLSAFTDLKAEGKVNRGLFLVPSVVQGQFHGEALNLLEPNKYRWHCVPGASREERIAAYKDPSMDFVVATHAAFRDDMLHLAAERAGTTPEEVADRLDAMDPAGRKEFMAALLAAEGIDADYLAIDEGHQLLNRQGKENSRMANVIDGAMHSREYGVSMTADPVKNDASEAFDVLAKMDPDRYRDRDAFMRRYGVDTAAAREGLRREMARHFYTGRIESGVQVEKKEVPVQLGPEQTAKLEALDKAAASAKLARLRGRVDVEAMKTLAPSAFEGVEEAQHADVARQLQDSIPILHATAERQAVDGGAKTDALAKIAKERKGVPGVVFAHSLARVEEIAERLKGEGHRVVTLTGGDSSKAKDAKKRAFQGGQHDIIICSDAGAVGANLQRGRWLVQYDTPQTAMVHAQRRGRIDRIGQKNSVELMDLVADHPAERRARKRLEEKYELRAVMTDALDGLDDTGFAGMLSRVKAGRDEASQAIYAPVPEKEPEPEPDEQPGFGF